MNDSVSPALLPYSANDLIALVFLVLSALFWLALKRTGERYFLGLSLGNLFSALAWGTTRYQSPGQPYVDWAWFWAQPLFASALVFLGLALVQYLPLKAEERRRLYWVVVVPEVVYIAGTSLLLMADVKLLRLWVILMQLPTIIGPAVAAMSCEKREPGMGHRFIGVVLLAMPAITVGVALSGATTLVLRFWTGIPAITLTLTMLTIALLRDRQRLEREIERRREAEAQAREANASLELKVQERTADLREMVDGLETFNRNISHDLRGPLGGIDMMAFLAEQHLERGDSAGAKEQIRLISQQVRQSHQTVDTLLLLARTMNQEARMQRCDLAVLVSDAVREAVMSVSSHSLKRPVPRVELGALGWVQTDPSLLRIAVVNLVSNALKFNLGRHDVVVKVRHDNTLEGHWLLEVIDNGIGFDPADARKALEPFERLQRAPRAPGHGLGLSIARRAVDRLGGDIDIQAAKDQGARFSLKFPTTVDTLAKHDVHRNADLLHSTP